MIDSSNYLNPKLFDADVEQEPIRNGFGDGLVRAGQRDPRVVVLCAGVTESAKALGFAKKFPERFVEIGVAEQNLASVASGMAAMGKIPFITSYAMFSPGRNWEQIRTTICYNNRPGKIAGSHAGVSVGPDGGTHQAIEDIAITRVIPRMHVVVPADAREARKATEACVAIDAPFYIRLAREKTPIVTMEKTPFEIGKANLLRNPASPKAALIACGPMVYNALIAAQKLADEGIEVSVLNNHTIKPMDTEAVLAVAKATGRVVTIEEHQAAGGMGSAVAEFLSQNYPVPMEIMGVSDVFGQSGTPAELVEHYGLGVAAIVERTKNIIGK